MELVTLAYRTQGLMLAAGNPQGVSDIADLTRPESASSIAIPDRAHVCGSRQS